MAAAIKPIVLIDNSAKVLSYTIDQMITALTAVGMQCEKYAKQNCPVDTGRLRNSITHDVRPSERAVYIGTNVEYAAEVEFNEKMSHRVGQAHYLRDAVTNHKDEYKKLAEFYLKK